jgi:hypothetical protein
MIVRIHLQPPTGRLGRCCHSAGIAFPPPQRPLAGRAAQPHLTPAAYPIAAGSPTPCMYRAQAGQASPPSRGSGGRRRGVRHSARTPGPVRPGQRARRAQQPERTRPWAPWATRRPSPQMTNPSDSDLRPAAVPALESGPPSESDPSQPAGPAGPRQDPGRGGPSPAREPLRVPAHPPLCARRGSPPSARRRLLSSCPL